MIDVGDVLVVRSGGAFGWLIRLAARLRGLPHGIDHVCIVHHLDGDGTPWVVEAAAPSGVRTASGAGYMASKWTVNNAGQPKTAEQRAAIANTAEAFVHTPYDWWAISADATNTFDVRDPLVHEWLPGILPAKFVCSSLASYVYGRVGLAEPAGGRFCTPAQWAAWIEQHHYNT